MTTIANIPLGYAYINFCLGGLVSETSWDNLTYIFLCQETWRILEITSEPTDTAEIFKYYALLKFKALDHFRRELSTAYDYSDQGVSKHRSQMFEQVSKMVVEAKQEALPYLPTAQIEIGRMSTPDDPYSIDGQVEHNV